MFICTLNLEKTKEKPITSRVYILRHNCFIKLRKQCSIHCLTQKNDSQSLFQKHNHSFTTGFQLIPKVIDLYQIRIVESRTGTSVVAISCPNEGWLSILSIFDFEGDLTTWIDKICDST